MPKRNHKTTAKGKMETFAKAFVKIDPPYKLEGKARDLFDAIIDSRERDTWVPVDLHVACRAAQVGSHLEETWNQVVDEGFMLIGPAGNMVENPRAALYSKHALLFDKLMRSLGLSGAQRGISGIRQGPRSAKEAQQKKELDNVTSLIAKPRP